MVPWEMWRAYRDTEVLAELWPNMVSWIDFAATTARTQRHPSREEARTEPAPHEEFLWDGGYHWGEWLEPGAQSDDHMKIDQGSVGTAFLCHSAVLAGRIGRLLGHDTEAAASRTWPRTCSRPGVPSSSDPMVRSRRTPRPTTCAPWPSAWSPTSCGPSTAERLVALIREAGTHLGTGFLATPYLLPVLADTGHLDVAYELLLQDTPPSWLAMVVRGATTVWELWEGIDTDGVPHESLNHYSKGAVISFLHNYVAGITLLDGHPAYRRFRVEPRPGGDLTWAEAVHDSPYGRIESAWHLDGSSLRLTVTVPPGTMAEVVLPDGSSVTRGPAPGPTSVRPPGPGPPPAIRRSAPPWFSPGAIVSMSTRKH